MTDIMSIIEIVDKNLLENKLILNMNRIDWEKSMVGI